MTNDRKSGRISSDHIYFQGLRKIFLWIMNGVSFNVRLVMCVKLDISYWLLGRSLFFRNPRIIITSWILVCVTRNLTNIHQVYTTIRTRERSIPLCGWKRRATVTISTLIEVPWWFIWLFDSLHLIGIWISIDGLFDYLIFYI